MHIYVGAKFLSVDNSYEITITSKATPQEQEEGVAWYATYVARRDERKTQHMGNKISPKGEWMRKNNNTIDSNSGYGLGKLLTNTDLFCLED